MAEIETDSGVADPLIADLKVLRKRMLSATPPVTQEESFKLVQKWLCHEVIPSIIAVSERMIESEELVDEMIDQQESYLQEDHATQIAGTIQTAGIIMGAVREKLSELDDVTAKRLGEAISQFERQAQLSLMIIANAAVEPDEGDDDDDDDSEDEDIGEDDETPVEKPHKRVAESGEGSEGDDE